MAEKKNNKINPFILILIYVCLIFAMYISLSTLALGIFGKTVMGTVDRYQSRLDETNEELNRSRSIYKGYFFIVDGKEYRGHVSYNGDELWSNLEEGETRQERISYLPFFPYINKPSMLAEVDQIGTVSLIYHIIAPIGYIFLFLLITGKLKKRKKRTKQTF
ncbi:MAG: hypothetical protein PHI22_03565 [Bacilli bacterium]|nr:hypothetical protein [Bacilli bacterium]MDD4298650.1 hypothetical protein [Bacilli bacterium]MDD4644006.1 hypothetical protein [Bacilli bacterium]